MPAEQSHTSHIRKKVQYRWSSLSNSPNTSGAKEQYTRANAIHSPKDPTYTPRFQYVKLYVSTQSTSVTTSTHRVLTSVPTVHSPTVVPSVNIGWLIPHSCEPVGKKYKIAMKSSKIIKFQKKFRPPKNETKVRGRHDYIVAS